MGNPHKGNLIDSRIKIEIGHSILKPEITDFRVHKSLACLRYYTATPIEKTFQQTIAIGTNLIDVAAVKDIHFGADKDQYYFIGVIREDYTILGDDVAANVNRVLAGITDVGNPQQFNNWMPMRRVFDASFQDNVLPDVHIEFDPVKEELRLIASAEGQDTLTFGYGFAGDETSSSETFCWQAIPYNHLDLVSKMAAAEYLREIIAGRGSISIDSDFTIELTKLETRLDKLDKFIEVELANIATPTLFFG